MGGGMEKVEAGAEGMRSVRLGLVEGEPVANEVLRVLGPRYQRHDPQSCDLRVIGPRELGDQGPRLLRRHRLHCPRTPALVVYGPEAPAALVRDCYRAGAGDVVAQTELETELERAIEALLLRFSARRDRDREAEQMAAELGKHARHLEATLERLRESYDQTLNALVAALDLREHETAYHSQRVAAYSVMVGNRLGLDATRLENLYRGALLHDIGKIGTPDAVLLKPGKFTEEEWVVMREHAMVGARMLDGIKFLRDASDVPRAHHEAWNGGGYPTGMAGEAIPLNARIFAVVDTYDAIRSKRPYKESQTHAEALEAMQKVAGRRLDPTIVECFVALPASTWSELEKAMSHSLTFEECLVACRRLT